MDQEREDLKKRKENLITKQRKQAISEKTEEEAARKKKLLKERVERIYNSLHLQP